MRRTHTLHPVRTRAAHRCLRAAHAGRTRRGAEARPHDAPVRRRLTAKPRAAVRQLLYDIQQSEAVEKAAAEAEAAAAALREETQASETQAGDTQATDTQATATAMDLQTPRRPPRPAMPVGVDCAATPSAAGTSKAERERGSPWPRTWRRQTRQYVVGGERRSVDRSSMRGDAGHSTVDAGSRLIPSPSLPQ
jgi:hypothetical protein